ncbi:MAG: hypothetical protein C0598_07770 [Marinilabiliales bacterium]|nr:MAG: hypothetical protein C0598_07770 [Marinilabiliales bacterium]
MNQILNIMKINSILLFLIIMIIISTFTSCKKDEPHIEVTEFKNALFIINEGNFTTGNSSLTYYNRETSETIQNVFFRKNNAPLGDVAYSISIDNESIYLVVNNSHTIYKTDKNTGIYQGKIDNLTSPRYLLKVNDSIAFVSDLYENNITMINTKKMSVSNKLDIGRTYQNLIKVGKQIFITNWSAFNKDKENNMLMIIDTESMQLTDSIQIGTEPNSIVKDKNDNLWILCSGGFMNEQKPSLWKIDPVNKQILNKIEFSDITTSPTNLCINPAGDSLYYLNRDVYKMSITESSIPQNFFVKQEENINFYSLAISPENQIFIGDANDYNRNGEIYRYSSGGNLIYQFEAGIIPGNMAFMD